MIFLLIPDGIFILDFSRLGRQIVFFWRGGEGLKIQKRQLIRNDIVALYFPFSEYPFFTLQKLRFKRLKGKFRSAKLPF